jgi:hypothetical protein
MIALALLLACTEDVPPEAAVSPSIDLGPSFSHSTREAIGCGWAYLFAPSSEDAFTPPLLTASLSLPDADATGAADVSYDRDLQRGDDIEVVLPDGADDLEYETCSDAIGWAEGVRVFTAEAGHVSFDATFVGDYSTENCGPTIDYSVWQATVELTDLELAGPDGETAHLDSFRSDTTLATAGCVP